MSRAHLLSFFAALAVLSAGAAPPPADPTSDHHHKDRRRFGPREPLPRIPAGLSSWALVPLPPAKL
ncbi:MAG: hypothetical protein K2W96_23220, partial [Gemmataceae bacterium]|nr:hypothetical protein [Gemmataceae bacterium]